MENGLRLNIHPSVVSSAARQGRLMAEERNLDVLDGVIERIVRGLAGHYLLHLEHGAGAVRNDRQGPFVDVFVIFSPIFFLGIPLANIFNSQEHQIEGLHVDSRRLNLTGKIRMCQR